MMSVGVSSVVTRRRSRVPPPAPRPGYRRGLHGAATLPSPIERSPPRPPFNVIPPAPGEGKAEPLNMLLLRVADSVRHGLVEIEIKRWVLHNKDLVSLGTNLLQGAELTLRHLEHLKTLAEKQRQIWSSIPSGDYPLVISNQGGLMKADLDLLAISKIGEMMKAADCASFRAFLDGALTRLLDHERRSFVPTLDSTRVDIEKRIGVAKKRKDVWSVALNVAFILFLGLTVPAFVIGTRPKLTSAFTVATVITKSAEKLVEQYWANRLKDLEEEEGIVAEMMKKDRQDYPLAKVEAAAREVVEHGFVPFCATVRQLDSQMKVERAEEKMVNLKSMMRQMAPEMDKRIRGMEAKIGACRDEILKVVANFRRLIAKRTR